MAACRDPANHQLHPDGRPARARARRSPTRPERDSGLVVTPSQVLVTNGGQAGGRQRLRRAVRPRRRGPGAGPVLDHLPRGDRAWPAGCRWSSPPTRPPASASPVEQLEAAWTPNDQGAAVRVAVQPHRGGLPAPTRSRPSAAGRVERGIWVLTDEIYEHLVYGGAEHHSMPVLVPELADRCIVVNGVAKTYAMTGWRVGWMIGPADVITRGHQHPVATRRPTWPTCPSGRRWPPCRAT